MASGHSEAVLSLAVPEDSYVDFRGVASPRHLQYMDLMDTAGRARGEKAHGPLPDGVIESGGKPVIYVVSAAVLAGPVKKGNLERLTRVLACRADAPYLAVVEAGITTVYRVAF